MKPMDDASRRSRPDSDGDESETFRYRLGILEAGSWFHELPADVKRPLLAACCVREVPAGGLIHSQGDAPDGLYAVLSGSVKVSSLSPEGRECIFRYLAPASWFGEIGMLDGAARTHDAVAVSDTTLLFLPPQELHRLLAAYPILYKFIALLLCRVVRTAFTMLNDTTLLSVSARLAKRLVSFAEAYGRPHKRGVQITLHMTQDQLAVLTSTTRQTINKRLVDWQKLGWIDARYGRIVVLNLQALRQLAESGG